MAAYATFTDPRLPASNVSPSEPMAIVPSAGDRPVRHFRSLPAAIKAALVLATHIALSAPTASPAADQTSDTTSESTVCGTRTRLAMLSLGLEVSRMTWDAR